jgi:hypothetical protein
MRSEVPIKPPAQTRPKPAMNPHFAKHMVTNPAEDFTRINNPFAGKKVEPRKPKEKQFERPDPSKKQLIREDMPIKVNPNGKYNLNFIDWDNEYETVLDRDPHSYESPIEGIDSQTF